MSNEINTLVDFTKATEKEQWDFINQYLIYFIGSKIKKHKEDDKKLNLLELDILDKLQTGLWFYVHLFEGETVKKAYIKANKGR